MININYYLSMESYKALLFTTVIC